MKRKQRFNDTWAAVLAATALSAGPALAQSAPVADGVGVPPERVTQGNTSPQVAPDVPVQRIELPATLPPALGTSNRWPLEVGYVDGLPEGLQPTPAWISLPDGGAVFRVEFTSENARGLRLQLRGELGGLQLRVYDPQNNSAFGPYNYFPGVWEKGEVPNWWTPTIDGTTIGLEFFQPDLEAKLTGQATEARLPEVAEVGYIYDDVTDQEFLGGGCLLDVTCYPAWANEARAIGRMLYQEGTSFFLCTGEMLNRNPQDVGAFSPILMNARHCIHDQPAANSLEIRWLYQTPTCNGTPPDLSTRPRNNGSRLLKLHHDADGSLLGLYEPTRADYFLGWDSSYWPNGSAGTGIHHPGGQPKKIDFGPKDRDTSCFTADHAVESNQQWNITETSGATRGGSSGSPALDANHRVRGSLSCGPTTIQCPPNDFSTYGRFDANFNNVRYFIYQMANPTYADVFFAGDPGSDGDIERGTLSNPFNSAYKASFAVPTGGTVIIRPGTYHEGDITLWRPMRLQKGAGAGIVELRR